MEAGDNLWESVFSFNHLSVHQGSLGLIEWSDLHSKRSYPLRYLAGPKQ